MSGKNGKELSSFNIIRYYGDPQKATVFGKYEVHRVGEIFVPEMAKFVPCAPYDNHFIYENPDKRPGTSPYMCTCGSAAVVAGMSSYEQDASPQGLLFICLFHAQFGFHSTLERKWI